MVWLARNRELCEQAVSSFEFVWSKIGNKKYLYKNIMEEIKAMN